MHRYIVVALLLYWIRILYSFRAIAAHLDIYLSSSIHIFIWPFLLKIRFSCIHLIYVVSSFCLLLKNVFFVQIKCSDGWQHQFLEEQTGDGFCIQSFFSKNKKTKKRIKKIIKKNRTEKGNASQSISLIECLWTVNNLWCINWFGVHQPFCSRGRIYNIIIYIFFCFRCCPQHTNVERRNHKREKRWDLCKNPNRWQWNDMFLPVERNWKCICFRNTFALNYFHTSSQSSVLCEIMLNRILFAYKYYNFP